MSWLDEATIESGGWYFQPHYIEFKTSQLDSLINIDQTETDLGFLTANFYKENGDEITTQVNADLFCKKSVFKWQPTYDIALRGATLFQANQPASDIRMFRKQSPAEVNRVMAIGGINLALLGNETSLISDLKFPIVVPYVAGHDYNAFEFTLLHGTAVKHRVGLLFYLWRK